MRKIRIQNNESFSQEKQKRKLFIIVVSILLAFAIILWICASYVGDYYRADQEAIKDFESMNKVSMEVLSIYGSEDGAINRDKYEECKSNLPSDFKEIVIDGGCHAYFGMYGIQDGDGKPTISREEQLFITVENIVALVSR